MRNGYSVYENKRNTGLNNYKILSTKQKKENEANICRQTIGDIIIIKI